MKKWTLAEMRSKVQKELDLEEETFIEDAELDGYFNEAIDICESRIHTLYEDYFLTKKPLPVVTGNEDIELPADIYADKIRKLLYNDNNANQYEIYPINNIKDTMLLNNQYTAPTTYNYLLLNEEADGIKIKLYPVAQETTTLKDITVTSGVITTTDTDYVVNDAFYLYSDGTIPEGLSQLRKYYIKTITGIGAPYTLELSETKGGSAVTVTGSSSDCSLFKTSNFELWYIRNAKRLVKDTDLCDIPEFAHYIVQYAKVMCMMKELSGTPMFEREANKLDGIEKLMIETLTSRKDDENNKIVIDDSFYCDSINDYNYYK